MIFDLGELGPCSDRADYRATAVNDCGVVVGYVGEGPTGGCTNHGWIWSLSGAYGLPARTMLDLTGLAGDSEYSEAWDINSDGLVVGFQYITDNTSNGQHPIVWRADQYSSSSTPNVPRVLLGDTEETIGEARGINTSTSGNPEVVGWFSETGFGLHPSVAFTHTFGIDPPASLTALSPIGSDADAFAYDVSSPTSSSVAAFVSGESSFAQDCAQAWSDSARWDLSGSTSVDGLREDFDSASDPLDLDIWAGRAFAVNRQTETAGYFWNELEESEQSCERRASFWRADATLVNLWADQMSMFPDNDSEAYGLTNSDPTGGGTLVVGADTFVPEAVAWWREDTPSSYGSAAFSTRRSDAFCARRFEAGVDWLDFREFQDVNSLGWIVGQGYVHTSATSDPDRIHAFMLVPISEIDSCMADLDLNGVVAAADLSILLGAWGTCPSTCCLNDLNLDGTVDAFDFSILLGAWSGVCLDDLIASMGCTENFESMVFGQESLHSEVSPVQIVLSVFGLEDLSAFSAWMNSLPQEEQVAVGETVLAILDSEGGS